MLYMRRQKTTDIDLRSTIYYYMHVIRISVYTFCSMYMVIQLHMVTYLNVT